MEGEAVYAPKRYFEHQDTWIGGHCDGFNLMQSVLDPERVFYINVPAAILNSPPILGLEVGQGRDLVKNGNFVDGTIGWTENSSDLSVGTNSGGGNYLRLSQNSAVTGYAYQIIRTTPGKRHKLTFKHKNGSFTGRVLVGKGVTGTEFGYIAVLNNIDWTEYILDFTPDTLTTYIVFASAGTFDDSFYRDISVTEMAVSSYGDVYVEGDIDISRSVKIKNLPVLGERQGAIVDAAPVSGTVTDVAFNDLISKFNDLLMKLRTHGLISE